LLAPVWIIERALCAWLAMLQLLRYGGVRYGDSVIRTAAHSERTLRRLAEDEARETATMSSRRLDRADPRSVSAAEPHLRSV
jgi:hypothetical protein